MIAAAGHHLFLIACLEEQAAHLSRILFGLLPDLDDQAASEVDDLYWQAGQPRAHHTRRRRPWVWFPPALSPGTLTRPGPASLAYHGVYCPDDANILTED